MTIRLNSTKLRELNVRSGPQIREIGNGYVISCPNTEDTYKESGEDAVALFDERQKQFIADQKEKAKKKIKRLKGQIAEQEQTISDIEGAITEAREQVQDKIDNLTEAE